MGVIVAVVGNKHFVYMVVLSLGGCNVPFAFVKYCLLFGQHWHTSGVACIGYTNLEICMSNTKSTILGGVKAGALALAFSCIGVLLLALIAKLFGLSDNILPVINQILKIVAVALAMILCLREEKFVAKGLVGSVVFSLLSLLLFSILGGKFNIGQVLLDFAIALVTSVIIAFVKARR